MTRLSDAQYLELAVQCLEHARQSTAIRDCQCHTCKGFMQQSGELIEDIRKRGALETEPTLSERMRDAGFKSRRAAIPDEPEGETCEQCGGRRYVLDVPCSACNAMGESPAQNR